MTTPIGLLAVRRSIFIRATPERVWEEFTTFERMARWFGTGHRLARYEPVVGGTVEVDAGNGKDGLYFSGKVLVYEPGLELTFDDDWLGQGWAAPSLMTIRLTAQGDGTLVELFHHAIERTGPEAADLHLGFEQGWTTRQLEALRHIVEA